MSSVSHLRLPLRLMPSGDFETVDQDTVAEVAQHATALVRTKLGSRLLEPTLGMRDTTFLLGGADSQTLAQIERQLTEHEPRAEHFAAAEGATSPEWLESVSVDVIGVNANG